jgi:hypothetical protein
VVLHVGGPLAAHDPAYREWELFLITRLMGRGLVLGQLKRPAAALESFRKVWELSEYPPLLGGTRGWLNNGLELVEANRLTP